MNLLITMLSFFSFSAYAANGYKLDMNILMDGKNVSNSKIVVKEGEKATMTKEDSKSNSLTEVSVFAIEGEIQGHKGILLDLQISHKIGTEKTTVTRSQVLVSNEKKLCLKQEIK